MKETKEELDVLQTYKHLFQNFPENVFMITHDLHYIYVNKAYEQFNGYSTEELLNSDIYFYTHVHNEDREFLIHLFKTWNQLPDGILADYRIYQKNGNLISMSLSATPLISSKGELYAFLGIERDITEQKMIEDTTISQSRISYFLNLSVPSNFNSFNLFTR